MNVGIRLHDVSGDSLKQRAQNAKTMGFTCTHLALSKVMEFATDDIGVLTPALASYVKTTLAPMDIAILGCYQNLAHPDDQYALQLQRVYAAHLRFAKWAGAMVVGTETGNPNAEFRYEADKSHTEDTLKLFIDRLFPVIKDAEKLGTVLAIEPVYRHIVCDAKRARKVLDTIASPNLQIILDPVNLLDPDNLARRTYVLDEALTLLLPDTAVLHLKDYVIQDGRMKPVAVGMGLMDYAPFIQKVAGDKPYLHITLENTTPRNAERAGQDVRKLWTL